MRVRARLDLSVLCGVSPPSSPASVLTLLSPEAHVAWRGDGDTLGMSTGPCTEARAGSAPIHPTVLSEPRKRDPRCTAFLFPGEGSARGRPAVPQAEPARVPPAPLQTAPPRRPPPRPATGGQPGAQNHERIDVPHFISVQLSRERRSRAGACRARTVCRACGAGR